VSNKSIQKIINSNLEKYGEFCWIDFDDLDTLDELPGQVIAELLYLGHLKDHLKPPFYNYLQNQFVYLAYDDGWYNKTYYRHLTDFYHMFSNVVPAKLSQMNLDKSWIPFRTKKAYPPVGETAIKQLMKFFKEGTIVSFKKMVRSRQRIELPLWIMGDFLNMDEMYDEATITMNKQVAAKLIFDKKNREWTVETC
ncbi:hypothetical protein J9303_11975, partial [Bacillaceae bacterium Marseille-Q3522]|nr:hypothetical protein [Bacillaceae bacterium Marseille-Q3522]